MSSVIKVSYFRKINKYTLKKIPFSFPQPSLTIEKNTFDYCRYLILFVKYLFFYQYIWKVQNENIILCHY